MGKTRKRKKHTDIKEQEVVNTTLITSWALLKTLPRVKDKGTLAWRAKNSTELFSKSYIPLNTYLIKLVLGWQKS